MPHPMSLFPLLGFRAPSNLRRRKAKEGKGLLERHGDYLIRTERRELALLCTLHGVVFTKIKWCPRPGELYRRYPLKAWLSAAFRPHIGLPPEQGRWLAMKRKVGGEKWLPTHPTRALVGNSNRRLDRASKEATHGSESGRRRQVRSP
jgi:hypothetical protein